MKVEELEGEALDYWVAKALGFAHTSASEAAFALDGQTDPCVFTTSSGKLRLAKADSVTAWNPSADWSCGGPIIERERVGIMPVGIEWKAYAIGDMDATAYGVEPLIAAMRAIVASKFGEEVEDAQPESAG
ncbi:phage protein NinX family protein [Paraburkholderia tropica]|uniref:phage protein NinX family protein n=1 Tax=Paraburkholderia tropica TaxID=92647 RepID=UPI002AB7236D|nr:phage protein NinX family protein [Paraburkholderia tropica]